MDTQSSPSPTIDATSPDLYRPHDVISCHGGPGRGAIGSEGRRHPSSVKSTRLPRTCSWQALFRMLILIGVFTTVLALYYINSGVIRDTHPPAALDRAGDIPRQTLYNQPASNKSASLNHPTGGQNTSPVQLQSGGQNTSPVQLQSGGQNTSPVQLQSGGHNTSPVQLLSAGQNTSPVQLLSGGQNTSPVQLQSGGQNTSPIQLLSGVQNTSPVQQLNGGQNASPVQLQSGGQNTLPANPSVGAKATQLSGDSRKPCPELNNIPNLTGASKEVDLEVTSMNTVETLLLGNMKDKSAQCVEWGNRQVRAPSPQRTPSTGRMGGYEGLLARLMPLELTVGNYSYLPGGHWRPLDCTPRWKVAIIIPFRHREYHLPILIRYLVPLLQKQLLQFGIFSLNQENELPFNRAMLMNVGFLEALNFTEWDCFVLHDVDHVPLSDLNDYGCSNMPKLMLSGSDRWNYRLPYPDFFGAVTGLTRENILTINGFPNVYWGWGGEDDEILKRVMSHHIPVHRTTGEANYYKVIKHHHISATPMQERFDLLRTFQSRSQTDGLSNVRYSKPLLELHSLYTNISVNIHKL